MSEKKYYWLKLPRDFFKRHDIKYIESLPDGHEIVLVYLQLMLESIDHDGELRFSPKIPYSEEMLASVLGIDIEILKTSMKVLKELELVKISKNGTIILEKVKNMVGFETEWARKKKAYREKLKQGQIEDNVRTNEGQNEDNVLPLSDKSKRQSKSKSKSKSIKENVEEKNITPIPPKDDEKLLTDSEKMFLEFWEAYPKKRDKQGCERAFKRIPKLKEVFPAIMKALEIQKQSEQWTKARGQYIPNPLTYIHQERWLDINEAEEMQVKIDEVVKQNYQKFLF
jgi:predicted phage replisome organizer